jgi:hypothetical protein
LFVVNFAKFGPLRGKRLELLNHHLPGVEFFNNREEPSKFG